MLNVQPACLHHGDQPQMQNAQHLTTKAIASDGLKAMASFPCSSGATASITVVQCRQRFLLHDLDLGAAQVNVVEEQTLLLTRESQEYSNVFHMLTDLFNAWLTMRMLGWTEDEVAPRRVMLLDNHPDGPLDGMWAGVAASGGIKGMQAPWNTTGIAGEPSSAGPSPE